MVFFVTYHRDLNKTSNLVSKFIPPRLWKLFEEIPLETVHEAEGLAYSEAELQSAGDDCKAIISTSRKLKSDPNLALTSSLSSRNLNRKLLEKEQYDGKYQTKSSQEKHLLGDRGDCPRERNLIFSAVYGCAHLLLGISTGLSLGGSCVFRSRAGSITQTLLVSRCLPNDEATRTRAAYP